VSELPVGADHGADMEHPETPSDEDEDEEEEAIDDVVARGRNDELIFYSDAEELAGLLQAPDDGVEVVAVGRAHRLVLFVRTPDFSVPLESDEVLEDVEVEESDQPGEPFHWSFDSAGDNSEPEFDFAPFTTVASACLEDPTLI
jgi:hypothetical protein